MSARRVLGIDAIDLVIQAAVTGCLMGMVGITNGPPALYPLITGASFLVWGVRRRLTLRRLSREELSDPAAERIAELEDRVRELEQVHDRMAELEERQDFAERLLARQEPGQLPK